MNRRAFLKTTAAAAVAGLVTPPVLAWADLAEQTLSLSTRTIEVNGRSATVYGLSGPDGKPGLALDAGRPFDVRLRNRTPDGTLVHWHGLTPPWDQDGVPNAPSPLLRPGDERSYSFPAGDGGTHWMHAHSLQEQALLAAPLIVRTREDRAADEQEVVVMLHDFSFTEPGELLARLKGSSHGNDGHAAADAMSMPMAHDAAPSDESGMAAIGSMDLNDIDYDAYLANDRTLDDPEVVTVERAGAVRLRIINAATATAFTVSLGGLEGSLIAVDGQPVRPLRLREVPLSMGQRADIRLRLPSGGAFPILALREGGRERTGTILATAGAAVPRVAKEADQAGPVVGLGLESRLNPLQPLRVQKADRAATVHLVGSMNGYRWSMKGDESLHVRRGERVEITMMNMSMMAHPMHLHGHHFQVVAIDDTRFSGAVRDTVLVPPMRSVTVAVDAENPGRWAFHCHHLYHMAAGMMGTFAYEGVT